MSTSEPVPLPEEQTTTAEEADSSDEDEPLKYDKDDELFDDNLDNLDEKFVNEQLLGITGDQSGKKADTDAHLSCPACFDTLCVQCQQHATDPSRFRALEVMNLIVDEHNVVVDGSEAANPCACAACGTQVAVRDVDGIYHFMHVLSSG
jgi:E2F-associated phosphoprotein